MCSYAKMGLGRWYSKASDQIRDEKTKQHKTYNLLHLDVLMATATQGCMAGYMEPRLTRKFFPLLRLSSAQFVFVLCRQPPLKYGQMTKCESVCVCECGSVRSCANLNILTCSSSEASRTDTLVELCRNVLMQSTRKWLMNISWFWNICTFLL